MTKLDIPSELQALLAKSENPLAGDQDTTNPSVDRIIAFFAELFEGMTAEVIPSYHKENTIYHKDGKFYMEQDLKNGVLWCRHEYWTFLQKDIGLNYQEIQDIVNFMVEIHFNHQVGTPKSVGGIHI